jgi:hypothetical protein
MPEAALFIPVAHVGHYLWILYVLPVVIVIASIVKTTISEKRKAREEDASPAGGVEDGASPAACEDDAPSSTTGPAGRHLSP